MMSTDDQHHGGGEPNFTCFATNIIHSEMPGVCGRVVRGLRAAGMLLVAALSASSIPHTAAFNGMPSFASRKCSGALVSAGRGRARISALGTRDLLETAAHVGKFSDLINWI